ncbi:putative protein ENHANCED DISEASE RESISTANCE 2 [Cocos nucifera]|nr:putative protein ENHANCED DISEASE RESISTANCE 2 [Cocos nucifera]
MSKVVYEGWMVRHGRRKIGRSFIHMRYFVLETRVLCYYKRKPQDNMVPIKTLLIDGNCRVEDRGLKMHHGHQQDLMTANSNKIYTSLQYKSSMDNGRNASSSDRESLCSPEEEEENQSVLLRRTTIGNGPETDTNVTSGLNIVVCRSVAYLAVHDCSFPLAGPPESVLDWTRELDSSNLVLYPVFQFFIATFCSSRLRIFEELLEVDYLPRSCSKAMRAVGVVEATCEAIFEHVMSMDGTRFEWDCSFQYGSLVEEVDGHTAILYHRLQLGWFPM